MQSQDADCRNLFNVANGTALALVPVAGKFAGAFIRAFVTRLEAPLATASGLMAKGVAEIALLLVPLHTSAIDQGLFSLLVLVMFVYIL